MWDKLIHLIAERAEAVRAEYAVHPYIFLILLVVCAPFFYYSIYRLARAIAARKSDLIVRWSSVFLAATAIPYLYVLVFGRNMPWWVYLVVGLLLLQGIFSLVRKLRRQKNARG
ncbi:MAG: hypothetical protein JW852_11675 [Spirochaetales bacterium]|nr:hypothetical protein [Spirochaetales bacterium]